MSSLQFYTITRFIWSASSKNIKRNIIRWGFTVLFCKQCYGTEHMFVPRQTKSHVLLHNYDLGGHLLQHLTTPWHRRSISHFTFILLSSISHFNVSNVSVLFNTAGHCCLEDSTCAFSSFFFLHLWLQHYLSMGRSVSTSSTTIPFLSYYFILTYKGFFFRFNVF